MKINTYSNNPPQTPYAPAWDFAIAHSLIPLRIDNLALTCLKKEREIKKLPLARGNTGKYTDGYTGLGKNSTTARFSQYNVLAWNTPETNIIKKYVRIYVSEYNKLLGNETPEHLWVRCWVNILRWGQKINAHMHNVEPDCYLSAHLTVQADDTFTCYLNPVNAINEPDVINEENIPGRFTIFPSYIPHYTTRHYSLEPRITIAMDIRTENDRQRGHMVLV